MLLEGRVAIVSGVGLGLGRSIALTLAGAGASVVLGARTREKLEAVAKEVEALGRQALVVPTDMTKPEQAKNIADQAFNRFGRIDVLVNNAAITGPMASVLDADVEQWRANVDGNLVGTMAMCKYTAPYMVRQKKGSIVNITSLIMRRGTRRRSAYGASKAGITLLSQSLADELGRDGIRVNCVAPGHIWSEGQKRHYQQQAKNQGKTYEEVYAFHTDIIALKRIPMADEVANAVLFFASDMSSCITGASLDANGGQFFH